MERTPILAALLIILLFSAPAFASSLASQNVVINLNEDGSSDWEAVLNYDSAADKSDFFILAYVKNVQVFGTNGALTCGIVEQGAGTLISCNKINESQVTYKFTAYNLIRSVGKSKMFFYMFPITGIMGEFDLTINLPLGAGIVEENSLNMSGFKPFAPETGAEGSDGRKIYVKWFFIKPQLGQSIETSVIYEQIFGPEQIIVAVALVLLALPVMFFFFAMRRKNRIEQVLPILNDGERVVMKKIMEDGGELDQRKIVRECDMSKSKVSRILKDLEERNLITMVKRGRSNKIKMVYHHEKKKTHETHEKPENHKEPEKKEKKYYLGQGEAKGQEEEQE